MLSAINGYLNFKVNKIGLTKAVLNDIITEGAKYGSSVVGSEK